MQPATTFLGATCWSSCETGASTQPFAPFSTIWARVLAWSSAKRATSRAILTHTGTIDRLRLEMLPLEELVRAPHVHVLHPPSAWPGCPGFRAVTRQLRANGVTVSVKPIGIRPGTGTTACCRCSARGHFPAQRGRSPGAHGPGRHRRRRPTAGPKREPGSGQGRCRGLHRRSAPGLPRGPALRSTAWTRPGPATPSTPGFYTGWLDGLPLPDCLTYGSSAGALSTPVDRGDRGTATLEELKATIEAGAVTAGTP